MGWWNTFLRRTYRHNLLAIESIMSMPASRRDFLTLQKITFGFR